MDRTSCASAGVCLKSRRWAGWIGVACLLWCTLASALSTGGTIRDFRFTQWGPKEGAPDEIQGIAQTSDGYLWVGNGVGLYRFDGLHFEYIDLPRSDRLQSLNVYVLFAPSSGGLWIGFIYGGAGYLKDGTSPSIPGPTGSRSAR